jgi:hypothetical protein
VLKIKNIIYIMNYGEVLMGGNSLNTIGAYARLRVFADFQDQKIHKII